MFKVVRFRARESTQNIPFAVLSAFKHHMENILKMSKVGAFPPHPLTFSISFFWGGGYVI